MIQKEKKRLQKEKTYPLSFLMIRRIKVYFDIKDYSFYQFNNKIYYILTTIPYIHILITYIFILILGI